MTFSKRSRCVVIAVSALVLVPLIEPAVSQADDGCGVGMYYDPQTFQCEPWAPVNVYVDPYVPVPIPMWRPNVDVDINPDIDINRPGRPGGGPVINPGRGGGGRGGRR